MKRATASATKARDVQARARLSKDQLAAMAEEATVDAHDDSEQLTGWFTMLEEQLEIPFETKVLGIAATVASLDLRDGVGIFAVCARGRFRQAIALTDLPLPSPKPAGSDWIEAYRYWVGRR